MAPYREELMTAVGPPPCTMRRLPAMGGLLSAAAAAAVAMAVLVHADRKSTRLNSSHVSISYAVFCLKKKNDVVQERDKAIQYLKLGVELGKLGVAVEEKDNHDETDKLIQERVVLDLIVEEQRTNRVR